MNGFLVLGGNREDLVPLRLCASRKEAEDFAATVTVEDIQEAADLNNCRVPDEEYVLYVMAQEFLGGVAGPLEYLVDLQPLI
jgi:hypothetical protein